MSNPIQADVAVLRSGVVHRQLDCVVHNTPTDSGREWQSNQQFIAMLDAYRPSGGLARAQEVATMWGLRASSLVHTLAGYIVKRQVVSLQWQGKIWLPLFQFNTVDMSLQAALADVLSELVVALDDWEIANWFALPNPWLADASPADMLACAAPEVLNAARAERYVALG